MGINIDEDARNADWLRTMHWALPTDLDEFMQMVGRSGVHHFMTLPAAEAMPMSLRTALLATGFVSPAEVDALPPPPAGA